MCGVRSLTDMRQRRASVAKRSPLHAGLCGAQAEDGAVNGDGKREARMGNAREVRALPDERRSAPDGGPGTLLLPRWSAWSVGAVWKQQEREADEPEPDAEVENLHDKGRSRR